MRTRSRRLPGRSSPLIFRDWTYVQIATRLDDASRSNDLPEELVGEKRFDERTSAPAAMPLALWFSSGWLLNNIR